VHFKTSKKNGELTQTWRSTHSSQNFQPSIKFCPDGHFENDHWQAKENELLGTFSSIKLSKRTPFLMFLYLD
jgi:hypothetical protein